MAEDGRDVLMTMVLNNRPIPSECQAVVYDKDPLGTGFAHISRAGGGTRPNYFAVENFTFNVALGTDPGTKDATKAQKQAADENTKKMNELAKQQNKTLEAFMAELKQGKGKIPGMPDLKLAKGKDSSEFQRFLAGGRAAMRVRTYPADLEEITITKQMDESSTSIFKACVGSQTFNQATLLKRKAVGESELRGFLRIDFFDVMITELEWNEGDVVKETFKFVCRKAIVQYSIEANGGKLTKQGERTWSVLNLDGGT